jgi:histidinol dehydrogenase
MYRWSDTPPQAKEKILKRSQRDLEPARAIAREWIAKIESCGDDALIEYIRKFDDSTFTKV